MTVSMRVLAALVIMLLLSSAACSSENQLKRVPEQTGIAAGITSDTSRIGESDPFMVTFFIRNSTDSDARLLIWNTPLESVLSADVLSVKRDGQPLRYQGRMVKRGKPSASNYLTLKPGDTEEHTFDLSRHYEVSDSGTYTVSFAPPLETGSAVYRIEDIVVELSDSVATVVRE